MKKYFWCTSGEDGTRIQPMNESEIQHTLDSITKGFQKATFLDKIPESDGACWIRVPDDAVVIISGEIIVPKAEQVAVKYKL
jgi:hypothetical protein